MTLPLQLLTCRIRTARRRAGLSQQQLAQAVGVGRSAVSQWERMGGTAPSTQNLYLVAEVLGISFTWLAFGEAGNAIDAQSHAPLQTPPLNSEEEHLLSMFRRATHWRRARVATHRVSHSDRLHPLCASCNQSKAPAERKEAAPLLAPLVKFFRGSGAAVARAELIGGP